MLSTNTLITMFNKHFHTPKHHVLSSDFVRHPIRFRPPSDQIPSATQSDSVRRPIGFRTLPDEISYSCKQH
jgi:hypothetical protein